MRSAIVLLVLFSAAAFPQLRRGRPGPARAAEKRVSVVGVVQQIDEHSLVIDATDTRILTIKLSGATRFRRADGPLERWAVKRGDKVRVEATEDEQAFMTAVDVLFETAPDREVPHPPAEVATSPARLEEDRNRPILRRGIPERVKREQTERETDVTPAPEKKEDEWIARAREAATSFTEGLPNYVCQQFTTRFVSEGRGGWHALDVVSAEVVYEKGKENYRNIAINGKPVKKSMEEMPGQWSTGEFGTTLKSLFSEASAATFRYVKEAPIETFTTRVYDFRVARPNSDWRIMSGSQAIIPAYTGRVWIDKKSARTLRIEQQAMDIPESFPFDKIEATNEYGFVRLGTDSYLLPTQAENLICQRGASTCGRNKIEFRNYHKYTGETTITFGK